MSRNDKDALLWYEIDGLVRGLEALSVTTRAEGRHHEADVLATAAQYLKHASVIRKRRSERRDRPIGDS